MTSMNTFSAARSFFRLQRFGSNAAAHQMRGVIQADYFDDMAILAVLAPRCLSL